MVSFAQDDYVLERFVTQVAIVAVVALQRRGLVASQQYPAPPLTTSPCILEPGKTDALPIGRVH